MWPLSCAWYGDRLAADYKPKPVDELQALLVAHGLDDEFWQLS